LRIVIGGAGEVGRGVAKALRSEGRDVVLIDPDPVAIKEAQALDVMIVQGDVNRRKDLKEAEVHKAEVFIAVTDRDEKNLIACALARDINEHEGNGVKLMTIARVHEAELIHNEKPEAFKRWSGVDYTVCSDLLVIKDLKAGLKASSMHEVLSLGNDAWVAVVEVQPTADQMVHKTLQEAEDEIDGLPRIFGMKRKTERSKIPGWGESITSGDLLAFATIGQHSFKRILQAAGHSPPAYPEKPRVLIFGATRLGQQIAASYLKDGSRVTVISDSLEAANELAGSNIGENENLDVMHGDAKDVDLLTEIDIEDHDISIAVLSDDHTNMAVSMQAAEMGVERTGLVLDDSGMATVARRIGQSFAISRRRVAINSILRRVHSRVEGNYHLLTSVPDLVGMSATIGPGHKLLDKEVSVLERGGALCRVAFILRPVRGGKESMLRASGDQVFKEGDRLMLFARVEDIGKVEERLLSGS
jgi:trk system potassium uptake protein TrkA